MSTGIGVNFMKRLHMRNRYMGLLDVLACFIAFFAIYLLVYPYRTTFTFYYEALPAVAITAIIYSIFLALFGAYRTDWVHAGAKEYSRLIAACLLAGIV